MPSRFASMWFNSLTCRSDSSIQLGLCLLHGNGNQAPFIAPMHGQHGLLRAVALVLKPSKLLSTSYARDWGPLLLLQLVLTQHEFDSEFSGFNVASYKRVLTRERPIIPHWASSPYVWCTCGPSFARSMHGRLGNVASPHFVTWNSIRGSGMLVQASTSTDATISRSSSQTAS